MRHKVKSDRYFLCKLDKGEFIGASTIPTVAQAFQCFTLCCRLTKMYMPIFLVRLDERTGKVFILAGEEHEISIDQDGEWRYET